MIVTMTKPHDSLERAHTTLQNQAASAADLKAGAEQVREVVRDLVRKVAADARCGGSLAGASPLTTKDFR